MNLKLISSVIIMVLGLLGLIAVLFASSPAVTPLALLGGALAFGVLFTYGVSKYVGESLRLQINN